MIFIGTCSTGPRILAAACYAERIIATIDEVDVNLISLYHLKVNKQASGRYKDLDDIEHLP